MVTSPYFYSWKGGYKLRIILFPRGNKEGEDTHLSIFTFLLENGEFDQLLSRSKVSGKIEIALLSQEEDKTDLAYTLNDISLDHMHEGWGFQKFISLEELEKSPYLGNDTIFIQVTCTKD